METNDRQYSLLLCDDDVNYGSLLADYLRTKGFEVDYALDGEEGWEKFNHSSYDIVVSDVRMPRKNGIELARDIRENDSDIPIVLLSALNDPTDIRKGYAVEIDEYVTKPCPVEILVCKLYAILRRTMKTETNAQTIFETDGMCFEYDHRMLTTGKETVQLSSHDADVLLLLLQANGETVERNRMLKTIWKSDSYYASRSLNVYITRLRSLLRNSPYTIMNVHGKGYKLVRQ